MEKREHRPPQDTDIREEESQGEQEQRREEEQGGVSDVELLRLGRPEQSERTDKGERAA